MPLISSEKMLFFGFSGKEDNHFNFLKNYEKSAPLFSNVSALQIFYR